MKMANQLPKIAPKTVVNRSQTPFMVWLRDKLNAIHRERITPPPGLPTPDGECKFYEMNRFPNTQSARNPPPAALPDGVHHKLAHNYYMDRDARREVEPPKCIYSADSDGAVFKNLKGETISHDEAVKMEKKEQQKNFGLEAPTPGYGYLWRRNRTHESPTLKISKDIEALEKYDCHTFSD